MEVFKLLSTDEIDELRACCVGSRVRLIFMNDKFAPPVGTLGTVKDVNCMGDLIVDWDNGSHLSVICGIDMVEKV